MMKKVSLTGDRPTGHLHLGHLAGSLLTRVSVQNDVEQFIIIADFQALTHNSDKSQALNQNIINVMNDYLAVGLEPSKNTFFVQSKISALHEIAAYYSNLVTTSRLSRNPTLKQEIADKNLKNQIPVSFFCHPISQAADITAFQADIVPVGEDQKPLIEQCNEIVRKFASIYGPGVVKEAEAIITKTPRLSGIDGLGKASKSMNNAIFLIDDAETVKAKVFQMYTDPDHLKVSDPGKVEGNIVFEYLDAFYPDQDHLSELKSHYRRGGLGDVYLKNLLTDTLNKMLDPMRERRRTYTNKEVLEILKQGCDKANAVANTTLDNMRKKIGVFEIN